MYKASRLLFRLFLGLFVLYLIGFGIIYSMQDRFIFQRQVLDPDHRFGHAAQELYIPAGQDIRLNALLFKPEGTPKGLVLYFHGNRHSLDRWGRFVQFLINFGYEVLIFDYRGYGKSNGEPSEEGLYEDAEAVYDYARTHFPEKPLIYYGRSLGTGVATHLAAKHAPQKLVLETPFDELKNVVPAYFRFMLHIIPLRHAFRNNERLASITCPILILHGTQDPVVPLSSALGLKPLLKPGDQFRIVPGGRHNNLTRLDEGIDALKSFLN